LKEWRRRLRARGRTEIRTTEVAGTGIAISNRVRSSDAETSIKRRQPQNKHENTVPVEPVIEKHRPRSQRVAGEASAEESSSEDDVTGVRAECK
jgi:hypothetical protein